MLHIYIDADSCPVKNEVYKVADRYELQVTVIANSWMRTPNKPRITLEVVGPGFDEADDWIVEHIETNDIVITADVLLAGRCVKDGARVLSPSGKLFTEDNIGHSVATRDLLTQLRGAGEITGGPAPLTDKDRSRFLQQLDSVIQSIKHAQK
ncbi:MAG: YaiI/YqxD family protein [Candidatus Marinimicrobia bacterium]|nr:YaiI/YqxD family protein [Candidatus Neomarinimicrobiota bacterium]